MPSHPHLLRNNLFVTVHCKACTDAFIHLVTDESIYLLLLLVDDVFVVPVQLLALLDPFDLSHGAICCSVSFMYC